MVVGAVAGADPANVVFDGTIAVGMWRKVPPDATATALTRHVMYQTILPQPVWQLFDADGEYQVPARWPDARLCFVLPNSPYRWVG